MRRGQRGDLFSQVVSEDLSVILIENSKQERTREGEDKGMGEGEGDEAPVGEAEGQPGLVLFLYLLAQPPRLDSPRFP